MSDHKRNRDHSPACGSRKIHEYGPGHQSPYQCSFQRSNSNERRADELNKASSPKTPPSTKELIIARFQGPLISASMEKTMKLRLQYLGAEHPDTLTIMRNLAEAWHKQQRYKECDGLRVHVLDATRNALGERHESSIVAMERLGATRSRRGYDIECERLEAQAVQLRKQTAGTRHPETVKAMTNLACTWLYLDRNLIAEKSLTSALRLSLEVFGEKHENTINAMVTLGEAKRRFKNYDAAEHLLERAYELSKPLLGDGHVHTLAAQSQLARTYGNHHRYEEAEKLHLESIDIHIKCLGERHPNTCAARFHLAETYYLQEKYEEAEPIMADVAMIRREVNGVIHPYTRRDANFLADIRSKLRSQGSKYSGAVEEIFSDEEELIVIGNQAVHSSILKSIVERLACLLRKVDTKVPLRESKLATTTALPGGVKNEKLHSNTALSISVRPIGVPRETSTMLQILRFIFFVFAMSYAALFMASRLGTPLLPRSTPAPAPAS